MEPRDIALQAPTGVHNTTKGNKKKRRRKWSTPRPSKVTRFWLSPGQPIDELDAQCSPMTAGARKREALPPRALTVIHFTSLSEYQAQQQGGMLAVSWPSWIVSGALVLASNNEQPEPATPPRGIDLHLGTGGGLSDAQLLRAASYYPQPWKSVCRLPNHGYRCGQFASWHRLSAWWDPRRGGREYELVFMLEADIYVTPRGVRRLESALAARPDALLFAGYTQPHSVNMDYFAFRPRGNFSAAANFWKRVFNTCNASHLHEALADGEEPFGTFIPTEQLLAQAVHRDIGQFRVHRLLNITLPDAGHAAIGIDSLGMWHEPHPWHVAVWWSVPNVLFRLIGAVMSFVGVGDLR